MTTRITFINPLDAAWTSHRFVLAFGAYGDTILVAHADNLEDALDECIDWIADHAPGLLCDDSVAEEYDRAIKEGKTEEEAIEIAECDTTCGGNAGNRILSWEWSILAEDPDRTTILSLAGRL